ncbi:MAG: hypothetical protein M1819_001130 [Sarea resinae]|nr:MAG: hypothetical protein M1819_001130 [Sarea resinae]
MDSGIYGSLYGLGICDALGGPVQFKARGTFPRVKTYQYNDHFRVPPGAWSDDTSMALCLAASLVENRGDMNVADQVRKYLRWFQGKGRTAYMLSVDERGSFDVGRSTRGSLGTWKRYLSTEAEADDEAVVRSCQLRIDGRFNRVTCQGNGSLMRVAPIALVAYARNYSAGSGSSSPDPRTDVMDAAATAAMVSSRPTHPHIACQEACALFVGLLLLLLWTSDSSSTNKSDLAASFSTLVTSRTLTDTTLQTRLLPYRTVADWHAKPADEISSSGWVIDTLEAALWGFFTTGTFQQGALKVVNLGADADTVGAVYGALGGAWYGVEAIPKDWIQGVKKGDLILGVAGSIVRLAEEEKPVITT